MKKIVEYDILRERTVLELRVKVTIALNDGWQPIGAPFYASQPEKITGPHMHISQHGGGYTMGGSHTYGWEYYHQAMVKYEKDN